MQAGWRTGPRIPRVPATPECWKCAEPDRGGAKRRGRVLHHVGLVVEGHAIGTVLLCAPCIETRRPLNPDPLEASEIA